MGNIKALHAIRRFFESEIPPEFFDRAHMLFVRERAARLLVGEEFLRVPRRHDDDVVLGAALRREERDLAAALLLREPALDDRALLRADTQWQEHLARDEGRGIVILLEKCAQDILVALLVAPAQEKVFAPDHLAAADEEDLHANARRRARHADGVLIARTRDDVLPLGCLSHGGKLIPQARRRLEVIRLRRKLHPMRELALHVVRAPFEEEQDGADHRRIVLLRDLVHAWRKAAFDMILKAGSLGHLATGT